MWKKLTVLAVFPFVFAACAGSHQSGKVTQNRHHRVDRYAIPKSDVPLVVNERVVAWIDYFTGPGRDRFGRYLKRSGRYAPMIRQTLKSYGVPQDVLYLAMIESGFSSKAKSSAAAVGVWQFIRATGNRYGLDQDIWIEERQDAEKETHAAAKYLRDLYNEFGDWYLAFAAYNSGEGTVRRAIARYGSKDFWVLTEPSKSAFRAETRDYVPKYIAAAIIAKNPEQFGFSHIQLDAPIVYETVSIDTHVDIDVVAKCVGVDTETIDIMNSELKLGTAPPHYKVKVPVGTSKKFHAALARIAPEDRVKFNTSYEKHMVGKHENLNTIAKRFGVKPGAILSASGLRNARAVKRGMTVTIPVGDMKSTLLAQAGYRRKGGSVSVPGSYKVKRGDTIKSLSEKFDVSVADLRDWNDLNGRHSSLKVGSQIHTQAPGEETTTVASSSSHSALVDRSPPPMPTEPKNMLVSKAPSATVVDSGSLATGYVVSVGDSWNSIAQNLGMSTKDLKKLNSGTSASGLHVGDVLMVSTASTTVASADPAPTTVADSGPSDDSSTDTSAPEPVVVGDVQLGKVKRVNVEKMEVESTVSKPKMAKSDFYKVQPGDSLEKIARQHGITVKDLKAWNNLTTANHIESGKKLSLTPTQAKKTSERKVSPSTRVEKEIPRRGEKVSSSRTVKETKKRAKVISYKVKPGDNIWTIGKKHNVSPEQMKQLSQLRNGHLKPGDVLTLRVGS